MTLNFNVKWLDMFMGMIITDKEGSSVNLAMILLDSLITNNGEYDPVLTLSGYLNWYEDQQLSPDVDWDVVDAPEGLGPTSAKVFQRYLANLSRDTSVRQHQLSVYTTDSLYDIAEWIYRETDFRSADNSAIYRCLPLALLSTHLNRDQLATLARTETRLTHASKIAQQTSAAAVLLAADLLNGVSWTEAVSSAAEHVKFTFSVKTACESGLNGNCEYRDLSRGSYCTDVLKAVIFFISQTRSLFHAIDQTRKFAAPNNYSTILVGAYAAICYSIEIPCNNVVRQSLNKVKSSSTTSSLSNTNCDQQSDSAAHIQSEFDKDEQMILIGYRQKLIRILSQFASIMKSKPRCY